MSAALNLGIGRVEGAENRAAVVEIVGEALGFAIEGVASSIETSADAITTELEDRLYTRAEIAEIMRRMAEITRKAWLEPRYVCPECAAGKCGNCDGLAWDEESDDYTKCDCAQEGHQ